MKKNVLVFGLISGVLISALMLYALSLFYSDPDFEGNTVLGYAAMLMAFSFVFVGTRNFRNKYNGGFISFGKAFRVGFYISLVASTLYVLVWLVDYYIFVPDFMEKYSEHVVNLAEKKGATVQELAEKRKEMEEFKEAYKNPVWVVLITYFEVLPIGLVVSLISALVLKRKPAPGAIA